MPLSPKNDQMLQVPGADQEQQIFEESFSQMAHGMLLSKYPQFGTDLATFKIIDSDIETGSAVGAFILQRPNGLLYIPAVLSDNQIKPLEIMYAKEADAFVPMTDEWLAETERDSIASLGNSVKTPETLYTDVDIRNLVVPPTTGRYSFASAQDLKLPEFLAKADNKTREKAAKLLTSDIGLFKVAVAIYGSKVLKEALQQRAEKVAEETPKTDLANFAFVTAKSDKKMFSKIFGEHAPAAMRGVAVKGFYAQDNRKNLKRPVDTESTLRLEEIRDAGAYKLYKKNGEEVTALVFPRPHMIGKADGYDRYSGPTPTKENQRKVAPHSWDIAAPSSYTPSVKYTGILSDGSCFQVSRALVGAPIQIGELTGSAASALGDVKAAKSGKGIFVRNRGGRLEGTEIVEVKSVSVGSDGVKRLKVDRPMWNGTIVIDKKHPSGRIVTPKDEKIAIIPEDYSFVPVGEELWEDDFITDPRAVASSYLDKLREAGAVPLNVKKASEEAYYVLGKYTGNKADTIYTIAKAAHISVPDAEEIIKAADEKGAARVLIATPTQLQKLAEGDSKGGEKKKSDKPPTKTTTTVKEPVPHPGGAPQDPAAAQGGMQPQVDPGMDPAAQGGMPPDAAAAGMDPSMMGGMPPPPSPTDQAVLELQEEVQRAHEEQMKLLQHKLDALEMVAQRTQEIVQGVPKDQSPAIQQAVTVANNGQPQPIAPSAPPAGMGGEMGGMEGGGVGGGMGGQMDGMGLGGQDSSGLMQQAAGLNDPSMFDAAAIGSLAEHSSLKDLVSSYVPTLEKSLDHIGRILLTLWIKGAELREEMGEENYTNLEDRIRNVFRGLGDIVLRLNQNTQVLMEGGDHAEREVA